MENQKKLTKLKLNRLTHETLENRHMNTIRGGGCGMQCLVTIYDTPYNTVNMFNGYDAGTCASACQSKDTGGYYSINTWEPSASVNYGY